MNYAEAIDFLKARTKFGINLGLGRITELLRRMGNPHLQGIKFIHVTGTNGKGSVSAMLSSILTAAGKKTGFFSSPHLHSYCERFRINGEMIPEDELAEVLTELAPHLVAMAEEGFEPPTEFEVSTAIALCWFYKKGVEFAVMEVGMGGSIDSTNVIPAKTAIITSVSMDHMDYLGNSIAEIAEVKSGIIKKGAAVFTPCTGDALTVIADKCMQKKAMLYTMPNDFGYELCTFDFNGQYFDFESESALIQHIYLPLLGAHQPQNASLAIAAALHNGIDEQAIRKGIAEVMWNGRIELFSREPLILIDGAHNVESMTALRNALLDYFPDRKIVAVLGMLADKEREQAMAVILPHISKAVITRPPNDRAGDWQKLANIAEAHNVPAECIEDISEAVKRGKELQGKGELLVISGSLYLIADARACLLEGK